MTIRKSTSEWLFQFTPLREGRLGYKAAIQRILHFNSRPSARGDGYCFRRRPLLFISIHAPPRGATIVQPKTKAGIRISIHAPPRGATIFSAVVYWYDLSISIHAPPRGATKQNAGCGRSAGISIHAPPRGATSSWLRADNFGKFQFTPLREGRRERWITIKKTRRNFNSRPSARGDSCTLCASDFGAISIHAPPRGATCSLIGFKNL